MWERMTDRARKCMALAQQAAQNMGHEWVGSEHILVGLCKEGSGVASNVLRNLDVSLAKILTEVQRIVLPGPDKVTMGKLPQTPQAKRGIEYAIEEAKTLGHNYVGSEHLLLGLLREQDGIAVQVLTNLGLKLETVREEILALLGRGKTETAPPEYQPGDLVCHKSALNRPLVVAAVLESKEIRVQ